MTKQAYLDQLRKYLKKLPAADYADAMEYFTEYFEEADEQVGEEVYISLLNKATKYCWFITPYLILTDEMIHAMGLAAKISWMLCHASASSIA